MSKPAGDLAHTNLWPLSGCELHCPERDKKWGDSRWWVGEAVSKMAPEEACPTLSSHPGPNTQAHPRAELELFPRLPSLKEDSEGSQSEPSPSPKQHKKSKKRKSLGVPVLSTTAGTVSAPLEALGLEREW